MNIERYYLGLLNGESISNLEKHRSVEYLFFRELCSIYFGDNLKKTPLIWIATGRYHNIKNEKKEIEANNILFTIAHELTHYFQWYFLEIDTRSDRSLEIEANKWAKFLVHEYLSHNDSL